MSLINRFDSGLRPSLFRNWAAQLRDWASYHTPPGQSGADHLVATLLFRSICALTIQGVLLIAIAPFVAPRLLFLSAAYLLIAGAAHLFNHLYGARAAWRAAYILGLLAIAPYIAVTGGIYSPAVGSAIMLTISSAFVFELNTTLIALVVELALLAVVSFLQIHGLWFKRTMTPPPGVAWMLIAQITVNYVIPIVTTIQAYCEALGNLEQRLKKLRSAEEEARSLLESQSRFFWDVSHELRSPLTRLNLSVAKVRREASAQAEPSLERIENEVDRLNRLLQQLLLLAQLRQGVPFPMKQHFDLAAEVASVCQDAEFEANIADRDLRVVFAKSATQGCPTKGCAELLRSAVDNVVRNALRFAPEGTEIEIHVSKSSEGLTCISVWDRGPGVPEAQISMLFNPFYRVVPEGPTPLQRTGSGLGLAIAYEAVRKHGGRIEARNRPGGGLVVRLEVPNGQLNGVHSEASVEMHASAAE